MENEYDEIDKMFLDYFSNKEIPDVIENGIATAMYEKYNGNKYYQLIKKIIITIISIITIGGGIVFAKEIEKWVKNIFGIREGIETAIENGYILNPEMEYVESNGIAIKVDNIIIDDYNLNINFNIKNNKNIKDVENIFFSSVLMYDENNNILYCNSEKLFNNFCKENNLPYIINQFNENNINNALNYYINERNLENNEISLIYNLSAYENSYPNSNKLYIYVDEIEYKNDENNRVKGEWKMSIEISDKFYNREGIEYQQVYSNDSNIKIIKAVAFDTEFKLDLEVEDDEQENLKNIDFIELREEMHKELEEYNKINKKEEDLLSNKENFYIGPATERYIETYEKIYQPIKDIYIENEKKERFYLTKNTIEDIKIDRNYDEQKFACYNTFDITKYDITNKMEIHFKYKNKENIIKILRK